MYGVYGANGKGFDVHIDITTATAMLPFPLSPGSPGGRQSMQNFAMQKA